MAVNLLDSIGFTDKATIVTPVDRVEVRVNLQ